MRTRLMLDNLTLVSQAAVGALLPLLVLPLLVRSLGLEVFGQLAMGLAWGSIGGSIVQYAFNLTGPRRLAQLKGDDSVGRAFWEISRAKMLLAAVVVPGVMLVGLASFPGEGLSAAAWLIVGLPVASAFSSVWLLQSQGRFLLGAILTMLGTGFAVTLALLFTGRDSPPLTAVEGAYCLVVGPLFTGLATFIAARHMAGGLLAAGRLAGPAAVLGDGMPLFVSQFLATVYGSAGPILIGQLAGSAQAGSFTAIERIVSAVAAACLLTHTAAYPRLARAYHQDRTGYLRMVSMVLGLMLLMAGLLALLLWVARDPLGSLLFGGGLVGSGDLLAWALIWLVVSMFGLTVTGYLTVSGRSAQVIPLTLAVLFVALVLGVPGILAYGAAGWMASLAISQLLVVYAGLTFWRRENAG